MRGIYSKGNSIAAIDQLPYKDQSCKPYINLGSPIVVGGFYVHKARRETPTRFDNWGKK